MILGDPDESTLLLSQPEQPLAMPKNDPPSYSNEPPAGPSSSSTAYPSDLKQTPTSLSLPLLFPPLYAPSPSSPFLVASSPWLDANGIHKLSFLALVKSINSSLQPPSIVRSARTAENVISHVPGLNLGYRVAKWALGSLVLGIVRGGVSVVEGGSEGKASRSIGKAQDVIFGASSTLLPKATQDLIEKANSPSGLFTPSSNLLLALVPYQLLCVILTQYEPLLDIPSSVASELVRSNFYVSSSRAVAPEQRKALRVRGRIDFRRWGWVRLEEENRDETTTFPSLDASSSTSMKSAIGSERPTPVQGVYSSSNSSGGTSKGGRFAHVDEKLSARNARRNSTRKTPSPSTQDTVTYEEGSTTKVRGDAGFAIPEEKIGEGTMFLVVVRRGLEALERFEARRV